MGTENKIISVMCKENCKIYSQILFSIVYQIFGAFSNIQVVDK